MTENEKIINNIETIKNKLGNLGVSTFSIWFGASYTPALENLVDHYAESVILYRCEFHVPTINANLIVEFKFTPFTPLLGGTKDVVKILTVKTLPHRDFKTIKDSNGIYELYEEVDIKRDIEKFNSSWDKFLSDPNARDLIEEKNKNPINEGLQYLRSNKDNLANLKSSYSVNIDSAVGSNAELDLSAISTFLSNTSIIKKIIYLFLQHRCETAKIYKDILSPHEDPLKEFSWHDFYKSNLNIRKNLAIDYLSKLTIRDLGEIVFNVNYNRMRGGFDRTHNRTTLTLAYFTLLSDFEELTKDDMQKINSTFSKWKIKDLNFKDTYAELLHNDVDNSLYFSLIENFYQFVWDSNFDWYYEEVLQTTMPKKELDSKQKYKFRFGRNSLKVLFSNLKSRGFIDTFDNKYVITDKGIDQFKNAVIQD